MSRVMEDLMPIGEFATASRLSHKALRLYGDKGLLAPAWVDPDSGYRYYRPEQLRTATLIALLRRAGIPLTEIRAFLREPTVAWLDEYEQRTRAELAERRRVLRYAKQVLEEAPMYEIVMKHVEEQPYVSREQRVHVDKLERLIRETFEELGYAEAGAPPFVLYHGPVNHEEDGPVEVCVPKPRAEKRLPAGNVAVTEISGAQCDFPEILGAYESIYRWAKENSREPAGSPREVYVNGIDAPLRMEIALPLR